MLDLTRNSKALAVGAFLEQEGAPPAAVEAAVREVVDGKVLFDSLHEALAILEHCGVPRGVRAKVRTYVEGQLSGGQALRAPQQQQQQRAQTEEEQDEEKATTEIHEKYLKVVSLWHAVRQWVVADEDYRALAINKSLAEAKGVLEVHQRAADRMPHSQEIRDTLARSQAAYLVWEAIVKHTDGRATLTDDAMKDWPDTHQVHAKTCVKKHSVLMQMKRRFTILYETTVARFDELRVDQQHENIRLLQTEVETHLELIKTVLNRLVVGAQLNSKVQKVESEWFAFVNAEMKKMDGKVDGKLGENTAELRQLITHKAKMLSASVIASVNQINAAQGNYSKLRAQQQDDVKDTN